MIFVIKNNEYENLTDALATIINSITDLIFKKISIFNLDKIVLVGGGRKNLTLKMSFK